MKVFILEIARKERDKLPLKVQGKFGTLFEDLQKGKELNNKFLKSLHLNNLYEFRVRLDKNIYRAIAVSKSKDFIIILFFQKKTQKIPSNILNTAHNRSKNL